LQHFKLTRNTITNETIDILLRYTATTMMTKFTVVLTTLFLAMTSINADKVRGLRSGPPGHGGPGGMGGPKGDFGGHCEHIDESALVDLSCDNDATEPDCALHNGELGNWLCRTMFDRFTGVSDSWSACGNATRALPMDECGCCEGACPVECTSGCSLEGVTDAGVLVTETTPSGEEKQTCLAPEKAISLIAKPDGRVQCVTE
jgi:hypothetical protein